MSTSPEAIVRRGDGRTVLLRGGGRWSHVLAGALVAALEPQDRLVWAAGRGLAAARAVAAGWASASGPSIEVCARPPDGLRSCAAVIASASPTRAADTHEILANARPRALLVEKPMAATAVEARGLLAEAAEIGARTLVNHEFRLASYIDQAATAARGWPLAQIAVEWEDPAEERRGDVVKTPDWRTDIVRDQASHAWSLLDRLAPGADWRVEGADAAEAPRRVVLRARAADKSVSAAIVLSRRSPARRRALAVDAADGRALRLDFSAEPGTLTIDGRPVDLKTSWTAGPRPLARAVGALLDAAAGRETSDVRLLDAERCAAAADFIDAAETALRAAALAFLQPGAAPSDRSRALMIDVALPALASAGITLDPSDALADALLTALRR